MLEASIESVDALLELLDHPLPSANAIGDDVPILSSVESFLDEFEPLEAGEKLLQTKNGASDASELSPELLLLQVRDIQAPELLSLAAVSAPAPLSPFVGPTPVGNQPKASRRRRRRPQEEIDDLRREVYKLTVQLDALKFQQTHGTQVDPAVLRATPPASWNALRLAQSSWVAKAAAMRQARQNSEYENQWLRALVHSTTARSNHLRGVFEKHIAASQKRATVSSSHFSIPQSLPWDSEIVFRDLLSGLRSLYEATDDILDPYQPIPTLLPIQQFKHEKCVFGEAYISFLESRVLPFGIDIVDRALWRALLGQSPRVYPNFHRDYSKEIEDDTSLTASRLGVRRGQSDMDIWIHIATRRYREPNRIVFVSRTQVKPKMVASGAAVGITYRETRIRILKKDGINGTVMQSHLAIYRECAIDSPGDGWNNGEDMAFASHGWRHSILALNQAIENLVLEEMVAKRVPAV